jgi:WD40 repeat protein
MKMQAFLGRFLFLVVLAVCLGSFGSSDVFALGEGDDSTEEQTEFSHLGSLPDELGLHILQYLDPHSLVQASKVNRHLRGMIQGEKKFQDLLSQFELERTVDSNVDTEFVKFFPDGKRLLVSKVANRKELPIEVWDISTGQLVLSKFVNEEIKSASFHGDKVVSVSEWGHIKVWDSKTGKILTTFSEPPFYPSWVEFFPDGRSILVGTRNGTLSVWGVDGKFLFDLENSHIPSPVVSGSFSTDGRVVIGVGNRIGIWDIKSRKLNLSYKLQRKVNTVSFFPDNKRILIGIQGGIEIWNPSDEMTGDVFLGDTLKLDTSHIPQSTLKIGYDRYENEIEAVTLLLGGKRVAAAIDDHLYVWDAATGELVQSLEQPSSGLPRRKHELSFSRRHITFSESLRRIVTLKQGKVILWKQSGAQSREECNVSKSSLGCIVF